MQGKQDYNNFYYAWTNGQPINNWIGDQEAWVLPVPDELFLNAEGIEGAQPWHGMTLEEQMAHLVVDPRQ